MSIEDYSALYSLFGPRFGGNGRTTFNLPDLGARMPIGRSQKDIKGYADVAMGERWDGEPFQGWLDPAQDRVKFLLRPPALGIRYCVVAEGVYPSRS